MLPSARRDSRRMTAVASTSLSAVGLGEPWSSSRLADVPHGIEQLTQLAAACASQPSILVLDEPLAGLSAGEVDEVATIARRLKARGVTIIVVEHQTRFIFEVCDAVTVLAAGELVKAGSAAEVAPTTVCGRCTSAYEQHRVGLGGPGGCRLVTAVSTWSMTSPCTLPRARRSRSSAPTGREDDPPDVR